MTVSKRLLKDELHTILEQLSAMPNTSLSLMMPQVGCILSHNSRENYVSLSKAQRNKRTRWGTHSSMSNRPALLNYIPVQRRPAPQHILCEPCRTQHSIRSCLNNTEIECQTPHDAWLAITELSDTKMSPLMNNNFIT